MGLFDFNQDGNVDLVEFAIGSGIFDSNSPLNAQVDDLSKLENE